MSERGPVPGQEDERVSFGYQTVNASEKGRLVREHFDTVARNYDRMNTLLSLGLQIGWKRKAVQMLGVEPGNFVLDVCGGTADLSLMAAPRAGGNGLMVVYDINGAMMKAGRAKIEASPWRGQIGWVQGDAEQISFPDDSFDRVVVGFGVRNLTRMNRGLEEMFRVLKPGGALVCLEFARPEAAWFRLLYDVYSFTMMPLIGRIFTGSWRPYTYLPESIRVFPSPDRFAAILREIGFRHVSRQSLTMGIAVAHRGCKPAA